MGPNNSLLTSLPCPMFVKNGKGLTHALDLTGCRYQQSPPKLATGPPLTM